MVDSSRVHTVATQAVTGAAGSCSLWCCWQVLNSLFKMETRAGRRTAASNFSHELFDAFDLDGAGTVDLGTFQAGMSILCTGNWEQRLRVCFDAFDK